MRSPSKTVIAELVERRSARRLQRITRAYAGQDTAFSAAGDRCDSQAVHLLVHSRRF